MNTELLDIRNMDCMELMAQYPDNHFDLAVVDPPYFKELAKGGDFYGQGKSLSGVNRPKQKAFKSWEIPNSDYFKELRRVSKDQIIWGANYYAQHIEATGRLVWDKENDSSTFSNCEIASQSISKGVFIFRHLWNGMLQADMKNKESRIHPTQKPVKLYDWIFANYAEPGMAILDTHLGSMSSAIAAHYAGMHLTGSELDADYFREGCERVARETQQITLF